MKNNNKKYSAVFPLLEHENARAFLLKHSEEFLGKKTDDRKFKINIQILKNNPDPKTRSFVAAYTIRNRRKQVKVIGVNRPLQRSNYEYRILKYLYEQTRIRTKIPRAYIIDRNQNVFFMEFATGRPLSEIINNSNVKPKNFRDIAKLLRELDKVKTSNLNFLDHVPYLKWIERDLRLAKKKLSSSNFIYVNRKWANWKKWWGTENSNGSFEPHFAHGDMNPKNIYIDKSRKGSLKLIDFDRSLLAPRFWDIAGFMSQLETYPELKISNSKREQYQKLALKTWENVVGSLSAKETEHIKLFRQYFRIAAIANIAVWGNPFQSKKFLTYLFKNLL